MDLSHNRVFWVHSGEYRGLYRVIFDFPQSGRVAVARIGEPPALEGPPSNGSCKEATAKPQAAPYKKKKKSRGLVGQPIWLLRSELEVLESKKELRFGEIKLPSLYYESNNDAPENAGEIVRARFAAKKALLDRRVTAMRPFLSLDRLRDCLEENGCLAELINLVTKPPRTPFESSENLKRRLISRGLAYKCWSLLCLYGFDESSLKLRYDLCGAPGLLRPCDSGGRKKPGAKTEPERQAIKEGIAVPPPEQPGTSTEWRVMVMLADSKIPSPKPRWKRRCLQIVQFAFVREFQDDRGELVPVDPVQGTYPNDKQIRHIITVETPKLILLRQQTTSGHFDRAKRGLTGKNWQGVAGPGHTWAIDSTVGDMYLRSSINRSWVIGRPIVYVIADVWSTAVVGFYVCLTGPSWDMAKISLFCSGADPSLIADLWGYSLFCTLDPHPTLPFVLMCDRGEYLSRAARVSGMDLRLHESYAPPYRPDLKGLIEVLHRIAKDEQFEFVPGSIDARRAEMERRKFDPRKAVFTVREYVEFLYGVFNHYNLTANREHRLDAHMRADGAYPSPAGLWRWGHQVGIGYRRAVPEAKLITDLLPAGRMTLTGSGVKFARALYEPPKEQQFEWATLARNFNREHGTCHYFPGSPSRIWTPHNAQNEILGLRLSDQSTASSDCTFDEIADIYQYDLRNKARRDHQNTMNGLDWFRRSQAQIEQARTLTDEALEADNGPAPTATQARQIEVAGAAAVAGAPAPLMPALGNASSAEYIAMMNTILNSEPAHA